MGKCGVDTRRTWILSLSPYHYFLCFAYSYALKMEAAYSSETSANI
jgi:hypothetical protein